MVPPASRAEVHVAVMAKPAVAGRVKTRLAQTIGPESAAMVHVAMARCIVHRLERVLGERSSLRLMAVDQAIGPADEFARAINLPPRWRVVDQGSGDLGARMRHVWSSSTVSARASPAGLLAFFGVDSPDLPDGHLHAALNATSGDRAAIGPAADGGYWTLRTVGDPDPLVDRIDWGTDRVYDQTLARARESGLPITVLPAWDDVDTWSDLQAILERNRNATDPYIASFCRSLSGLAPARSTGDGNQP